MELCSPIRRLNIGKMEMPPEVRHKSSAIPIKIPMAFVRGMEKVIWNFEGPRAAQTIFEKKNKVGGLTFADFKTGHKASVNQNSMAFT